MLRYVYLSIAILLILGPSSLVAQDMLTIKNLNFRDHFLQRAPFDLAFVVASDGQNAFTVFMEMKLRQQRDLLTNYEVDYALINDYESRVSPVFIKINFERAKIAGGNNIHYLKESLDASEEVQLALFRIRRADDNRYYYHLVPLRDGSMRLHTDFIVLNTITGAPVFGQHLPMDTEVKLESVYASASEAYLYHYEETFYPADPPMIMESTKEVPELVISEEKRVAMEEAIPLNKSGFYFFQTDSTAAEGRSVVMTDRFFPRRVIVEDVMEPLVYLSSADEYKTLLEADNPKLALDNHLVKISKEQKIGRDLMRDYFRNVSAANSFFTTYKQGWKTDMGMIYSVYGEPDEVHFQKNRQEWVYLNRGQLPRLTFFFSRVPNVFTSEHYVLTRDRRYADFWFGTVDSWRKGRRGL
jgi:GWxTD domain-containing protein